MTARNYDVILNFATSPNEVGAFEAGNTLIGNTTSTVGIIANVDLTAKTIKVKYANNFTEFKTTENVHSNVAVARVLNVDFKYSNANTTGAVVNNLNYGELNQNLEAARFAIRTAGNEFSELLEADSKDTTHTNALLLPVQANNKNEITVILNNTIVHPDQYLWTGDLAANANQHASFGGNVQLNSQTTFNVVPMFANAVVFKNETLARDVNVTIRIDTANLNSTAFEPAVFTGNTTTAISPRIASISNSPYIKEKNSFTQNPIVRLIKIYYPGEWYPPNKAGNPTLQGEGLSWPVNFPFSIAEINGDIISDLNYNVTYDGDSYSPYPVNVSAMEQKNDGEINEITVTLFNFENTISALIEDPFIAGNNKNNSAMAVVNGEIVNGIDPRTINVTEASDISNWTGFPDFDLSSKTTANLSANILHNLRAVQVSSANVYNFSSAAVSTYGKENAAWTRDEVISADTAGIPNWDEKKLDSRDLLGAVVEIKSTFANFLDFWPEYSTIKSSLGNAYEMTTTMPYRVGDSVKSNKGDTEATIEAIEENRFLFLSNDLAAGTTVDDPLYIINVDADPEAFLEDVFKIENLDGLNDVTATFTLASWLQYFKFVIPKRKYYKNTCQWEYKGAECQYPGAGQLPIPGTDLKSNANPIKADNTTGSDPQDDVCGKSLLACQVRNNDIHFGAFPATGRTIPRQ
jgi:phage-related protein